MIILTTFVGVFIFMNNRIENSTYNKTTKTHTSKHSFFSTGKSLMVALILIESLSRCCCWCLYIQIMEMYPTRFRASCVAFCIFGFQLAHILGHHYRALVEEFSFIRRSVLMSFFLLGSGKRNLHIHSDRMLRYCRMAFELFFT